MTPPKRKSPDAIATKIVQKLFDAGFIAYFAGGWVRDHLRNEPTDEIDIATSASPEQIIELFPKTIPVGIAFGVIIVVEEGINFEISTFRKDHPYIDGRHPEGVDFSTPEKDAMRRDFTINGMFYDPLTQILYDYVDGQTDLKKKLLRAIGNPHHRFTEDRLRMIRAVRFSARFGFTLDPDTEDAIYENASTLFPSVSIERVWQELVKMSTFPHFDKALLTLHQLQLLQTIFPTLKSLSSDELQKRVAPFPYFPLNCPTILYLLELFPEANLGERLSLCQYLKTKITDAKLAEFFYTSSQLLEQKTPKPVDWAHFYAHPHTPLFLEVQKAKLLPPKRQPFHQEHQQREQKLAAHIKRIQEHRPLVTATLLQSEGIKPGKIMGKLLREAERITINEDLSSASEVLERLKTTSLWPK
ncbi:MAG: CCA-adding enzyme [Chlamydiae bacterium]|nr:CCA-adding enzyme [Chlamydiota bacterium]